MSLRHCLPYGLGITHVRVIQEIPLQSAVWEESPSCALTGSKGNIFLRGEINFCGRSEHFQCPTMEGAEIENGGGGGTTGSHWEQRVPTPPPDLSENKQ